MRRFDTGQVRAMLTLECRVNRLMMLFIGIIVKTPVELTTRVV